MSKIEALGDSLRALPDALVAMQREVTVLGDRTLTDEAQKSVEKLDALVDKSLGIVMTVLEYIDEWTEGIADQTRPNPRINASDGIIRKVPPSGA